MNGIFQVVPSVPYSASDTKSVTYETKNFKSLNEKKIACVGYVKLTCNTLLFYEKVC